MATTLIMLMLTHPDIVSCVQCCWTCGLSRMVLSIYKSPSGRDSPRSRRQHFTLSAGHFPRRNRLLSLIILKAMVYRSVFNVDSTAIQLRFIDSLIKTFQAAGSRSNLLLVFPISWTSQSYADTVHRTSISASMTDTQFPDGPVPVEEMYQPKDAVGEAIKSTLVTGGAGLFAAAIQSTMSKRNVGAFAVFTHFGSTIAIFGMNRPATYATEH